MKRSCKGIMAAMVVFFSWTLLFAQQPEDNQKETEKAEVSDEKAVQDKQKKDRVYTAGEILVRDKKIKPGTVSVIDGESVKNSTKTDAINLVAEKVPSFNTGNNRVMGFGVASSGAATMSIRGIGVSSWSPQTGGGPTTGIPILINGMDAGMMINNHPVADIFSMKNIDRIEVLHGPQPVLYGGGAMGGIINIITKRREQDGYDTEVSASYGSWNTTEDYIMHYGKMGAFDYGVSYNFRYTDGARDQTIGGYEFDSQYMSNNGTMHLGYQVNKNWYAGIDSYLMGLDIHDPGAEGVTTNTLEYFDILRGGTVIQVGNSYDKLEGSLQLYGNWGRHTSRQPANDIDAYKSFDQMLGLKAKESLELDFGMTVTGGAEYRYYGGKAENQDTGYIYTDDKYIQEGSLYGLVDQSLFENFWILSAGGRYTYNSKFGSYGAWQAGTVVNPTKTTKLHFQSAQGFKVPDIIQYYNKWFPGEMTADESDADLKPETYISIEVGVEQSIFDVLVLSATGYRIYSDNKFSKRVLTGTSTTNWYNSDEFNYNGLEATVSYTPLDSIALNAGYSFIDTEQKGRILPYVPKHKFISGIQFNVLGFMVSLNGEFLKDIYANEAEKVIEGGVTYTVPLHKLDDYFVLNAKIAYGFLEHYRVFLDLNNITNKEYATYAVYATPPTNAFFDYPMPGFNWRAGVSATF